MSRLLCCRPPYGSVRCDDCPLPLPDYSPWPFVVPLDYTPITGPALEEERVTREAAEGREVKG